MQSAAVVVPPVPAVEPPEKTFLTCQVRERVRAGQLLREHGRVGRGLDALPDVAPGHLVVAVAGAERRREADVDVGLRRADDPRDPAQRLGAPEVLGQRRALVVEEVDRVDVEDVDRAGAVVRDAVLVLAPQAERRADLRAGGVAAALTAGDHDDPAADVVALVPHAARADDARVVIRMGPLAHHVDLRPPGPRCNPPPSLPEPRPGRPPGPSPAPRRNASRRLLLVGSPSHLFERFRTGIYPTLFLAFGCCQVRRGYPREIVRLRRPCCSRRGARRARERRRRAAAEGRRWSAPRCATAPPHTVTGTLTDGTTPLAGQEVVLEGRRYPYEGSYRVIERATTAPTAASRSAPSSTATTACASPRPRRP